MELDVRTRGRAGAPMVLEVERELVEDDLPALALPRSSAKPSVVKRLSERHHALARCLASGASQRDAAIICGYDLSRISILLNDPSFTELLAFYRADVDRAFSDMHDQLATVGKGALGLLIDKIEDEPESLTVPQLMELAKLGADRTGYGPQTRSENLNVNVNVANRLEEARKRLAERRAKI